MIGIIMRYAWHPLEKYSKICKNKPANSQNNI
jgi:hypothetical protein